MLERAYKIFFETLGNKNRLMILESLEKNPKTVTELSKKLGMDQTTVSHNLRRLQVTGFVKSKKIGRNRIYELNKNTVKPLLNLVDHHMRCNCGHLCKCKENEFKQRIRR